MKDKTRCRYKEGEFFIYHSLHSGFWSAGMVTDVKKHHVEAMPGHIRWEIRYAGPCNSTAFFSPMEPPKYPATTGERSIYNSGKIVDKKLYKAFIGWSNMFGIAFS